MIAASARRATITIVAALSLLPTVTAGPATAAAAIGLTADPATLAGHGEVAFVTDGKLYLVGGPARQLRQVSISGTPSSLSWSHDGRWLAVTTQPTSESTDTSSAVIVYTAAGHLQHRWSSATRQYDALGWSPTADVIALLASPTSGNGDQQVLVAHPRGGTDVLAAAREVAGAVWSPDGDDLAVSLARFHGQWSSRLARYSAGGGSPTILNTDHTGILIPADWWPDGSAVLAWVDPQGSASLAADGLPLAAIDVASHSRHQLVASMLVHSSWITASAGRNQIAVIAGGDRELTEGHKHVVICTLTQCRSAGRKAGTTALDPAFSPRGPLAWVRDTSITPHGFGAGWVSKLQDSGGIVVDGNRKRAARVATATGKGATYPQWGDDGSLLYLRHDSLWLLRAGGRKAHRVAGPITTDRQPTYYGYVPWATSVAWTAAPPQEFAGNS